MDWDYCVSGHMEPRRKNCDKPDTVLFIMKMKRSLIIALMLSFAMGVYAKGPVNIEGKTVPYVKIRDLQNQPIDLPSLGKAPLLLFYVDPDHAGQNSDFIEYLESHPIGGDKIVAYGIVNLKDAPMLPNSVVRSMMRAKQKKTGAAMYTDVDNSLRDAWGMGDVNNQFVIIFVTKDRKVEFFRYGDFTEKDKADFWRVVNKYK